MQASLNLRGARAGNESKPTIVLVPLDSLLPSEDYPRLGGVDEDHARALAETHQPLPPILIRRSMRIIDGMHRFHAARLRGLPVIPAIIDESDDDTFLLAVRANIGHGLPLTLRDRKAAAMRILRRYPEKSDRAVAELTGLSGKTIGAIRRSTEEIPQLALRVGKDGRPRPVDGGQRRRTAW